MLYTRCPECETTFRITESALQQAKGQVRCGRCAHIFDAHDSLTDRLPDPDDPTPEPAPMHRLPARATPLVQTGLAGHTPTGGGARDAAAALIPDAPVAADRAADGDTAEESLALAADIETAAREAIDDEARDPPAAGVAVMSADEVDAVLDNARSAPAPHWLEDVDTPTDAEASRRWLVVGVAAALILGVQVVHHFRSALAGTAGIGGFVQGVYALLGQRVVPNWDVNGYELVDWVAIEAPGRSATQRNLVIRSELRNAADKEQPYPLLHLKLLDRWEDAVGARLFEPAEYATGVNERTMMSVGDSVAAELVIVDPGTDAYGFELAVCLETATGIVCDTDATFR